MKYYIYAVFAYDTRLEMVYIEHANRFQPSKIPMPFEAPTAREAIEYCISYNQKQFNSILKFQDSDYDYSEEVYYYQGINHKNMMLIALAEYEVPKSYDEREIAFKNFKINKESPNWNTYSDVWKFTERLIMPYVVMDGVVKATNPNAIGKLNVNDNVDPVTRKLMASALPVHGKDHCPRCGNKDLKFVRMALCCPNCNIPIGGF